MLIETQSLLADFDERVTELLGAKEEQLARQAADKLMTLSGQLTWLEHQLVFVHPSGFARRFLLTRVQECSASIPVAGETKSTTHMTASIGSTNTII